MADFFVVGEDQACCSLAKALIVQLGGDVSQESIEHGFGRFVQKIPRMNAVALNVMPVLMLADGDQDACVVAQRNAWMPPHPADQFCLRIAVREAESWVLSDREGFSRFTDVAEVVIPRNPDDLRDPKQSLLTVVRRSRKKILRDEMLPSRRSTAPIGLGYNIHLRDFIENAWSAERAAQHSPSLSRALAKVAALIS